MKRCNLHSGLLRHQVDVERLILTPDGIGGSVSSWAVFRRPWAYIISATGWERLSGMQLESPITHIVYLRYDAEITARHRIIHRDRAFNIRSIADIEEQREWLELKCEEGVAT